MTDKLKHVGHTNLTAALTGVSSIVRDFDILLHSRFSIFNHLQMAA
jgi:hypothetical protein